MKGQTHGGVGRIAKHACVAQLTRAPRSTAAGAGQSCLFNFFAPAHCRSEGRIDNGNLACAYHGWEFDSAGSCVRIPQIADPKAAAAAAGSQRACLKMHPTMEAQVRPQHRRQCRSMLPCPCRGRSLLSEGPWQQARRPCSRPSFARAVEDLLPRTSHPPAACATARAPAGHAVGLGGRQPLGSRRGGRHPARAGGGAAAPAGLG